MSLAQPSSSTRAQFSGNGIIYFDFIRVLATNLVVFGHAGALFQLERSVQPAGMGVVLFFILSGFLIMVAAMRRWERSGPQFGSFMIDRCARIFVPFLPILLAVALVNALLDPADYGQMGFNRGPVALAANALLLNDYPLIQAASQAVDVEAWFPRSYNTAEPFWTLPLEFWTYVVFALLFFGLARREPINRGLAALLLAVAGPVFLWNTFAGGSGCLTLVWVVGAVAGHLWYQHHERIRESAAIGWLMLGFGLLAWLGRMLKVGYVPYEFQQAVFVSLVVFGAFLVIADRQRIAQRTGRIMTLLASYSYSLFLIHNTVIIVFVEHFAEALGPAAPWLAIVAAHAVAVLFYLAFERNYQHVAGWLKRRHAQRSGAAVRMTAGAVPPPG